MIKLDSWRMFDECARKYGLRCRRLERLEELGAPSNILELERRMKAKARADMDAVDEATKGAWIIECELVEAIEEASFQWPQ